MHGVLIMRADTKYLHPAVQLSWSYSASGGEGAASLDWVSSSVSKYPFVVLDPLE
jgi:hypothetical protein